MTKEIKVGIFVIITAVVFFLGMNFLKGNGFFDNNITYYSIFDKIDGLQSSDAIVVNGFQVGVIGELTLISSGKNKGKILSELRVYNDVEIPVGSKAVLFSADLLGEMNVKILYNDEKSKFYKDGDTISTNIEGSLFEELGGEITPLTDKLGGTIDNVNQLFDFENEENNESLNYTLKSLNEVLATYNKTGLVLNQRLDKQMASLDGLLSNVESLTATLQNNEENIDEILNNFNTLSASLNELELAQTLETVNTAVNSLNASIEKLNQTDNSIGALLNDREVYDNLEKSTESLNLLLNDVRINPKRYVNISVFGGKKQNAPPIESSDLE